MNNTELKTLARNLDSIFKKSGKAFPVRDEKEMWLKNYKNHNPNYKLYKIDEEKFRKNAQSFFDKIAQLSDEDQAKFYATLFKYTQYYYLGHESIDYFKKIQKKKNPQLIRFWPLLKSWITRIDNWAHADMIASLYCDMLTEDPKTVLPVLETWSEAKNPWKNRMAIVSLFYYYNPKRISPPIKTVEKIMLAHLAQDHYYVQKAIGWCLREISSAYPKEYKRIMEKHLLDISSTAFSTSVEKCETKLKESWKLKRKEARKKK